jgi:hypothetical protein
MLVLAISQNWAVVPIVLGAVGYLLVAWRRSAGRGGCCGHAESCMPSLGARESDEQGGQSHPRPAPKQFIHVDQLAYRARALRKEQDDRAAGLR